MTLWRMGWILVAVLFVRDSGLVVPRSQRSDDHHVKLSLVQGWGLRSRLLPEAPPLPDWLGCLRFQIPAHSAPWKSARGRMLGSCQGRLTMSQVAVTRTCF